MIRRTVYIRGKRYTLLRGRVYEYKDEDQLDGTCDYERRTIRLWTGMSDPLRIIETAIHETEHGAFPDLNEDAVRESAESGAIVVMAALDLFGLKIVPKD